MKKLISLLLAVGLISTLFVACTVGDKVLITDEYDYNEMLTQTRTEIFDTLEITESDVSTLAQGEIVLLPENFVKSYLGYDFDVMLIFTSTDDDAQLIMVKYYIDYSGDPESAVATSEDLYNKMSAIYGDTYEENIDGFIDKSTSIAINSTLDIYAKWDLNDDEIEEKLGEVYAEVYGDSAEIIEQTAFTSQVCLHSNSGGEIINVYIQNYLVYTPENKYEVTDYFDTIDNITDIELYSDKFNGTVADFEEIEVGTLRMEIMYNFGRTGAYLSMDYTDVYIVDGAEVTIYYTDDTRVYNDFPHLYCEVYNVVIDYEYEKNATDLDIAQKYYAYTKYDSVNDVLAELGLTEEDLIEVEGFAYAYELPETVEYLGYDFNVWLCITDYDDPVIEIEFAMQFDQDVEGALDMMDDLYEKLSVNYGDCDYQYGTTYDGYTTYNRYDLLEDILDEGTPVSEYAEIWSVAEYGFSEYEILTEDGLCSAYANLTLRTDIVGDLSVVFIRFDLLSGVYGQQDSNYIR